MIEKDRGRRPLENVVFEELAVELRAQVVRQVVGHVLASIAKVTVDAVGFAEGVVQGSIERARRDLGAKNGDRLSQSHSARNFAGSLEIFGLKLPIDIDGVRRPMISGSDGPDFSRQLLHG